ncbi:MAG: hypothetical protein IPG09_12545 [Ignavibacteria bacterium]|nr:hypothetical protein [Ignavibacteria bacterium]
MLNGVVTPVGPFIRHILSRNKLFPNALIALKDILFVPTGTAYFFVAHCDAVGVNTPDCPGAVTNGPELPPLSSIREL